MRTTRAAGVGNNAMACAESWGVWPCSTSLPGNVVLMGVYGRVVLLGANLIAEGSEQLLEVLDPGIIGGLLLPVLGALPDTLIVVFSGAGGNAEEAAERIAVGMGTLAGSTAMLLSIGWGGSLLVGRCDLHERGNVAIDGQLRKPSDVWGTGATCDNLSRLNAGAMLLTAVAYLIMQVPAFFGDEHDAHVALAGVVVSFLAMATYMVYQVKSPELQNRRKALAHETFLRHLALNRMNAAFRTKMSAALINSYGSEADMHIPDLVDNNGSPNDEALEALFSHIDEDGNGYVELAEFKRIFNIMHDRDEEQTRHYGDVIVQPPSMNEIQSLFAQLDSGSSTTRSDANDARVTLAEFKRGMRKWLLEHQAEMQRSKSAIQRASIDQGSQHPANALSLPATAVQRALLYEDDAVAIPSSSPREDVESQALLSPTSESGIYVEADLEALSPRNLIIKAICYLVAGTVVCAIASDPLVDAVSGFSTAAGLPSFYVAFVATPFASNASELFSSLQFAAKKRKKIFSMTLSQIYGAVCMNNTLVLGTFLVIVYSKRLAWTYSAETLVTLVLILIVGLLGMSANTFRTWTGIAVIMLYPLAVALVVFLKQGLGWR